MLRQSSSRSHRSKKLRPSHTLQAVLLVAVSVWIVYQLTRSYGKQRGAAVEADGNDGEPARRRLGRKGFVVFGVGQASVDGIAGVGGRSDVGRDDSFDDPLSTARDGEGDEEDQEADEDDGVNSDDAGDADDGLAADEEDDDRDLQSQNGSGSEDELKTAHLETQDGLNISMVPPVNTTDTVQNGVGLPVNATGGAADGTALNLNGSALKNTSSVDLSSLHERGTADDAAKKLPANGGWSAGDNQDLQISKNGTADSVVAGQGISS
ncbi:hypothetical protein BAE44_0000721 [Dichanthelium oligosanthes]|uniref:Uncharacterized protein n=1 Tax=Dichanthelium oligosanthes TaxID=888268 RepID=A0A1E5WLL3_9POAL|nr:hypothetical protein BAE44_0000721 [Dichanthelium oligosanthes]